MHKTIHPEDWKPAKGYANGVLARGAVLEIAGQVGWNVSQEFVAQDFVGQMEQALFNVRQILETSGGQPSDLTRLTWYVTDKREYLEKQKEVGKAYRRVLGNHFPAMTMVVVSGLVEDEALVEIEATAVIANPANGKTY